jgi:serine/threonine protein kinase
MAPEQVEGKEAHARSDIFSFGAIVYEMVTGKRAFEGKSAASVVAAILEREPPAMSSLQPLTPRSVDRIVATCLAKDPDDRWQTARDLLREMRWIAEAGTRTQDAAVPVSTPRGRVKFAAAMSFSLVVGAAVADKAVRGALLRWGCRQRRAHVRRLARRSTLLDDEGRYDDADEYRRCAELVFRAHAIGARRKSVKTGWSYEQRENSPSNISRESGDCNARRESHRSIARGSSTNLGAQLHGHPIAVARGPAECVRLPHAHLRSSPFSDRPEPGRHASDAD